MFGGQSILDGYGNCACAICQNTGNRVVGIDTSNHEPAAVVIQNDRRWSIRRGRRMVNPYRQRATRAINIKIVDFRHRLEIERGLGRTGCRLRPRRRWRQGVEGRQSGGCRPVDHALCIRIRLKHALFPVLFRRRAFDLNPVHQSSMTGIVI